jgi:hypothetical protein
MGKELKNITGLTKKVGGSLPLLKNGIKRSVVLIETGKIGLITDLFSTVGSTPLKTGLNPTLFLCGEKV